MLQHVTTRKILGSGASSNAMKHIESQNPTSWRPMTSKMLRFFSMEMDNHRTETKTYKKISYIDIYWSFFKFWTSDNFATYIPAFFRGAFWTRPPVPMNWLGNWPQLKLFTVNLCQGFVSILWNQMKPWPILVSMIYLAYFSKGVSVSCSQPDFFLTSYPSRVAQQANDEECCRAHGHKGSFSWTAARDFRRHLNAKVSQKKTEKPRSHVKASVDFFPAKNTITSSTTVGNSECWCFFPRNSRDCCRHRTGKSHILGMCKSLPRRWAFNRICAIPHMNLCNTWQMNTHNKKQNNLYLNLPTKNQMAQLVSGHLPLSLQVVDIFPENHRKKKCWIIWDDCVISLTSLFCFEIQRPVMNLI